MYQYNKAIFGMLQAKGMLILRYIHLIILGFSYTSTISMYAVIAKLEPFLTLQASGAYIFRPTGSTPSIVSRSVSGLEFQSTVWVINLLFNFYMARNLQPLHISDCVKFNFSFGLLFAGSSEDHSRTTSWWSSSAIQFMDTPGPMFDLSSFFCFYAFFFPWKRLVTCSLKYIVIVCESLKVVHFQSEPPFTVKYIWFFSQATAYDFMNI